ncbi:sensor histidine kinase [Novosphingobium fuchskuhlense]|uniref:sensor histidine kinase n=1 Tax=Novosphingobium fuchskuhlense TaxID=1117702 RepID=UPI0009E9C549|nr:ATP-binding protein [Novosphingobium fuchskuhlense]
MTSIPYIVVDKGLITINEGILINLPTEFFSVAQKSFYAGAKSGWHRCPLGYQTFSVLDALGRKIVFPGILDASQPSPNRKFPNHPLRFSRIQIEKYAASHLDIFEKIREQRDAEFRNLTHDLRAISTEIYHGSLNIRESVERALPADSSEIQSKVDLIINAQSMMSIRLDIIDYESGLTSGRPQDYIQPYPKVHKVLRCFDGKLKARRITWKIEGQCRREILGPSIFEIVPFVIVENALKYAPHGSNILVRFEEKENEIIIRFESLGPKIKDSEKNKIFDRDYRGESVRNSSQTGSGIGLFAAKTIAESHFKGRIFVNQFDAEYWDDGECFYETRFTVVLPTQDSSQNRR